MPDFIFKCINTKCSGYDKPFITYCSSTEINHLHKLGKLLNRKCPKCASNAKRIYAPFNAVFKGSGFTGAGKGG